MIVHGVGSMVHKNTVRAHPMCRSSREAEMFSPARNILFPWARHLYRVPQGERVTMHNSANFLIGVGAGVAIGLLLAPAPGEETRENLKAKADEGKEYLRRRGSELRESVSGVVERQKGNLTGAVETGKQAYRDAVRPKTYSEVSGTRRESVEG
jgi:gas vesicle protein